MATTSPDTHVATQSHIQNTEQQPPPQLPESSTQPSSHRPTNSPRLNMPFDRRLLLTTSLSLLCGFTLGSTSAGRLASLRFRAENAHRLPISQPGWYLYHKSKNYYKWRAGISEGVQKAGMLAAWSLVFFVVEESLDVFRGTWRAGRTMSEMEGVDELSINKLDKGVGRSRDFLSSACAGMVTGGVWSAWHGFPVSTAARTIRMGLLVGLGYGALQDGIVWAKVRWGGDMEQQGESWWTRGARNKMKAEDSEIGVGT